jgi:hypothetical protein
VAVESKRSTTATAGLLGLLRARLVVCAVGLAAAVTLVPAARTAIPRARLLGHRLGGEHLAKLLADAVAIVREHKPGSFSPC